MSMPTVDGFVPVTAGTFSLNLPVPNDPGLTDALIATQAVGFPSTGPFGTEITNGLLVVPGL